MNSRFLKSFLSVVFLFICSALFAQEYLYINKVNSAKSEWQISTIDSITFSDDNNSFYIHNTDGSVETNTISEVDSLTFNLNAVYITYSGTTATVVNPYAGAGVTVSVSGADVTATSTLTDTEVIYVVSGTAADGMLKLYSAYRYQLIFDGVNITNVDGPAINIQSGKKGTMIIADGTTNTLADGSTYAASSEDQKATLFSEGQMVFCGNGILNVQGNYKHAICSDDYIRMINGTINITGAANDGLHINDYFQMDGGTLSIVSTGDGIDGDAGYIELNGGTLTVTSTSADVKAIKCDSILTINGGTIKLTVSGNQSKGFKTSQSFYMNGGSTTVTASGGVVVSNGETSYCTAVKCDGNYYQTAGSLTVISTGIAGKGISADGEVNISGGTINITTSGNGGYYTATSGGDTYSSSCINSDGNMYLLGGNFTLKSSGTGGKCIKADKMLTIGTTTGGPTISATTTGARYYYNSTYSSASKAIKATGNLVINGGTVTATTSTAEAEAIESKAAITINGGDVIANAYDDAINAAGIITFNGGRTYAYASNNDAVDSNYGRSGAITINGGILIAAGSASPEEGIDADNNAYLIFNGGTVFAMGGNQGGGGQSSSSPTCKQGTIYMSGLSLTVDRYLSLISPGGTNIFTVKIPRTNTSSYGFLSDSDIISGTCTLYTGSVAPTSYSSEWQGLYLDTDITTGTSLGTATVSSNYGSVGSGSSGGGGRPGGGGPGGF